MQLGVKGINAQIMCDFELKFLFFKSKGHITAQTKGVELKAAATLETMEREESKLGPKIDISTISLDINSQNFDIEITGGMFAKFLNYVEHHFTDRVLSAARNSGEAAA